MLDTTSRFSALMAVNAAARYRRRAGAVTLVAALFGVGLAVPATARSEYDGNWSVLILTRRGACDPAVRYGVQITNGVVTSANNGPALVQGQVSAHGAVRVGVRSGPEWATGSGLLGRGRGSGVWQGQGTSGACAGTWLAQRRGYGVSEDVRGAPRYYNYYRERY